MTMRHVYLSLAFVLVTVAGTFAQASGTIFVFDQVTGLPVENATVELNGTIQTTNAAGVAYFSNLGSGDSYQFSVTAPCYISGVGDIIIASVSGYSEIALEPLSTTNTVFFFIGSPMAITGATVQLTDGADFNATLVTSSPFGGDVIEGVPFGEYSYTITIPCYETVSGTVTVECNNGDGIAVFAEPVATTANAVFFFVGSPLTIPGATIFLSDGMDYNETITTGAPFGDIFENVPFGEYSYSITAPCYEPVSGTVTVDCTTGDGIAVFVEPVATTANAVFFFVGSPLTIPGATIFLSDGMDYNETITTGAPFGDIFENVPFGAYSYSITAPCYEPVSGTVTVDCTTGDGIAVFVEPVATTANAVFFFVGSPLTIPGATIFLSDGVDYNETITTGAPFGDIFENVPFGAYSYSITAPCYEPVSGTVTVDCTTGDGIAVFVEPVAIVLDATVSLDGATLTATATGVDYQWVDCDNNNEPIAGATAQSFDAPQDGSYAVIITSGNCSQSSECLTVIGTAVSGIVGGTELLVYPNPFQDVLSIRTPAQGGTVQVQLFSTAGQLLRTETSSAAALITLNTAQLPAGSYILRLTANGQRSTFPVVK